MRNAVSETDSVDNVNHQHKTRGTRNSEQVISVSVASQRSFELAGRVAPTNVSVLIHGDSGTGKEVVARYIHKHSPRTNAAFVAINCAAIPEQMLEAMLFGHEKGAFTGAHTSRTGKFEQADGGTLLLDEISEMDLSLQAKLLRVLQEREIERVGGRGTTPVDVRVIATTNQNLLQAIENGRFREDLYYRLNVFPVYMAPLKERVEDIVPLTQYFINRHAQNIPSCATRLSSEAISVLTRYAWPGNVRELENLVQRALVMSQSPELMRSDFDLEGLQSQTSPKLGSRLLDQEVEIVRQVLVEQTGSRKASAAKLGISERTLRHKMQKWREQGIDLGVAK